MKAAVIVLVLASCSAEPRSMYVDSQGYWDPQTGELIVGATYLEYDSSAYYAHKLAAGQDVVATLDGAMVTLPKRDPIPQDLPDQDVWVAHVPLTDAPDGKLVAVDVTGDASLHSELTIPPGFDIVPIAPRISRASSAVVITWAPRSIEPIQWWIHPAACLDPAASDHSQLIVDDNEDIQLDPSSLSAVIVDPSGECAIVVTVQRVANGVAPLFGQAQGIQTRNVTFTSIP